MGERLNWSMVWSKAAAARYALEYRLLGSILCDPLAGLKLADGVSVDAGTFQEPDLQAIYLAAVVKRMRGELTGERFADRLAVALLAREAVGRWARWTDDNIDDLFHSEFSTLFVPIHAGRLEGFAGQQREAVEHLRYAYRLMTEQLVA